MRRTTDQKVFVQRTGRRGSNLPAALCRVVGTLILLCVIAACLPVPLAHLAGYEIYNIVSGSMEPAIPVGSAIYVQSVNPAQLMPGDVIAFQSGGAVVAHRVVENDPLTSGIVTKGDANAREDRTPVQYSAVIGRVTRHVPMLGGLLSIYTGGAGRIYLLCFAAAGALLNLAAGRLAKSRRGNETPDAVSGEAAAAPGHTARGSIRTKRKKRKPGARGVLMILLAVVFAGSVIGAILVSRQDQNRREVYIDAALQYVAEQNPADGASAPVHVEFDALRAVNSDIVGWIYCEGTPINYPVLQCGDNDTYLRHDYLHNYSIAGSIFIEAQNRPGFADANTIIYGHHMTDGSMFAALEQWQQPGFYEEHPVIWLLTPEQTYQIELFSGYSTNAYAQAYTIFTGACAELDEYLQSAAGQSVFDAQVTPTGQEKYVLLSTCAKAVGGGEARQVLHGILRQMDNAAQE